MTTPLPTYTPKPKVERFTKAKFVQQAYEHSQKLSGIHKLKQGYGTLQLVDLNKKKYTLTHDEMQALITRAVGYGRMDAIHDVATWVDNGTFGV